MRISRLSHIIRMLIEADEAVGVSVKDIEERIGPGPTSVSSSVGGFFTLVQKIPIFQNDDYFKTIEVEEGSSKKYWYKFKTDDMLDGPAIEEIIKIFHEKEKIKNS